MKYAQRLFPILFIIITSMIIYANTFNNGFVYDDQVTIVNNILIKNLGNISKLFQLEYFNLSSETTYRPLVTITYFFDYSVYGLKPWGYHLTNTLIHATNGALLYILLTLLSGPLPSINQPSALSRLCGDSSFIIALLFATHPILTEAVNAISFREDLLVFTFYMATLILYILLKSPARLSSRFSITVSYLLSCITYSLALLSKEMAVTLPAIVFCYEWIYEKNERISSILLNRFNIGYLLITLTYLYLRFFYFYEPTGENFLVWEFKDRLFTVSRLLLYYIKLVLLPVSLSATYVISPERSLFSLILSIVSVVSIAAIPLILFKKRKETITFGILFSFITPAPVYNIIPIVNPLAERYLYLPTAGFTIAAVLVSRLIFKSINFKPETRKLFGLILVFLIICLFTLNVVKRNSIWRNGYSLWSDTVRKMPNSSCAHNNLGIAYTEMGRFDEAIQQYLTALVLQPEYANAHNNLGLAYHKKGLFDKAMQAYQLSLGLAPNDPDTHYNLGIIYVDQGRFNEAIMHFRAAIELKPNYSDVHINLGIVYYKQGRFEEAINEYKAAEKLKQNDSDTHYNLGLVYIKQGMPEKALQELETANRLNPYDLDIHYTLADTYYRQGLLDKARTEFEAILKLNPNFAPARQALESLK